MITYINLKNLENDELIADFRSFLDKNKLTEEDVDSFIRCPCITGHQAFLIFLKKDKNNDGKN